MVMVQNDPVRIEREAVPIIEESATVGKQSHVTETVQVRTVIHEREQPIDVQLSSSAITIERVPVNRFIDDPIPDRQDGDTTIISVIEEVAVVEMRLKLVEEVRITRRTETQRLHDTVTVRRQDVTIERRTPDDRSGNDLTDR